MTLWVPSRVPNDRFWEPFPRSFGVRPNTRKSCSRVGSGKVQRVGGIPKSTSFPKCFARAFQKPSKRHLNDILHDVNDFGYPFGVPLSPGNPIKCTLWRHTVENGAHGSKIMPCAPKMVPSGPKMKPQLSPKSCSYHRNMILTPSGTVAVLGAHATVDIHTYS